MSRFNNLPSDLKWQLLANFSPGTVNRLCKLNVFSCRLNPDGNFPSIHHLWSHYRVVDPDWCPLAVLYNVTKIAVDPDISTISQELVEKWNQKYMYNINDLKMMVPFLTEEDYQEAINNSYDKVVEIVSLAEILVKIGQPRKAINVLNINLGRGPEVPTLIHFADKVLEEAIKKDYWKVVKTLFDNCQMNYLYRINSGELQSMDESVRPIIYPGRWQYNNDTCEPSDQNLSFAVAQNAIETVKYLLRTYPSLKIKPITIQNSATKGYQEMDTILLNHGADSTFYLKGKLLYTAKTGNLLKMKQTIQQLGQLIRNEAILVEDARGLAVMNGHLDILLYIDMMLPITVQSAGELARYASSGQVLDYLVSKGYRPTVTLFIDAVANSPASYVRHILDTYSYDREVLIKQYPLKYISIKDTEMLKLILVKLLYTQKQLDYTLALAVESNFYPAFELLINAGATLNDVREYFNVAGREVVGLDPRIAHYIMRANIDTTGY